MLASHAPRFSSQEFDSRRVLWLPLPSVSPVRLESQRNGAAARMALQWWEELGTCLRTGGKTVSWSSSSFFFFYLNVGKNILRLEPAEVKHKQMLKQILKIINYIISPVTAVLALCSVTGLVPTPPVILCWQPVVSGPARWAQAQWWGHCYTFKIISGFAKAFDAQNWIYIICGN